MLVKGKNFEEEESKGEFSPGCCSKLAEKGESDLNPAIQPGVLLSLEKTGTNAGQSSECLNEKK